MDAKTDGLVKHDEEKAYKGYTLFSTMYGNTAYLIDMKGKLVHKWNMKNRVGPYGRLLPNGNLLWLGRGEEAIKEFLGCATELVEVDWDGNEVWRYDDKLLNHDFSRLPNGNTIINRYVEIPEKIAKKIKGGIKGTEQFGKIYSCCFQEITYEGEIIWEWKHYEHLDTDTDILCPLCTRSIWGHSNALDVLPNGNILFTLRHLNTIGILDKKSGDIIWRWGPENYLGHMHNPTVLDNGNILLFDNGWHRLVREGDTEEIAEEEYSRVIEVDPNTNKVVWDYHDRPGYFYSTCCGGAQRLPNGNTLITESIKGRFFEVTPDKEIVWEYINEYPRKLEPYWIYDEQMTLETFRAYRYGINSEEIKKYLKK